MSQQLRNAIRVRAAQTVLRFGRKEDGTVTIFGMMMFILMLGIGGIAVDVMRYETQRVQLQYTLDRAVLAAAALNQTLDPEAVVLDYLARSGLQRYRIDVDVEQGVNFRRVTADAEMDIDTIFMDMFGIRALTTPAYGAAEERIQNVEISMVLDVSGSMGWSGGTKLDNMQAAATEFVSAVMESNNADTDEMLVSVSVVPYNGYVNVGSTIESVFTLSSLHSNSTCTRFMPSQFDSVALSPSTPLARLSHFDYNNRNRYSYFGSPYCPDSEQNAIIPWSNSVTDLQAHINGFQAGGWTAIDQAMRWAVALLDPAAQPAVAALHGAGDVHEDFVGRPAAYTDDETLKIVVLMTDGENTEQWDVSAPFRSGDSPIYYHEDDDRWSMYMPSLDVYWIPDPRPGDSTTFNNPDGIYSTEPYGGSESQPRSWQWMWANFTEYSIAHAFYYYASYYQGEWDLYDSIRYDGLELFSGNEVSGQQHLQADANLRAVCDAARAEGIIVFTIAFEAPPGGQSVMQYCATSTAHYYDVEGIEISEAFASIANTINQLKLIQ